MARFYDVRVSEMLGIDNSYEAYCIDEAAMILYSHALTSEGTTNWDRIYNKAKTNQDLIDFIKRGGK